jgi:hypothetical protein
MNGTTLFEETQNFSPWLYGLAAFLLAVLFSLLTARQTTTVTAQSVDVRFGIFYRTSIPLSDLAQADAVAYRPIREYGGWGIRGFGKRRALNMRGDRGVLLIRKDGSTILIGSQKPRELLAALGQAGVPTQDRLPAVTREF